MNKNVLNKYWYDAIVGFIILIVSRMFIYENKNDNILSR